MGRPGGGIMALRGHTSIQGSTDIPTLFDLLPGYLPMPHALQQRSLDKYIHHNTSATGWWSELPKYIVSLLKAWFGDFATKENDFGFNWLPALSGNHSHMTTVADMADGKVKGYLVMGENPTVGSMHGALHRKGLRNLDWLVVRDFPLIETAEFWRTAPEIARGEVKTEEIKTEVFFFPAATHTEKDGSFTNTQRLLQWHHKAIEPPGDCRSDLWFAYHLGKRLKKLYAGSSLDRDRGIQALTWDYREQGPTGEPDAEAVLKEVSGYTVADGTPVPGFAKLQNDGSTACGCWIYSGCYADGVNQTARRKPQDQQTWVAPEWGWAWLRTGGSCTTALRPTRRGGHGPSANATFDGTKPRRSGPAWTPPTSSPTDPLRTDPANKIWARAPFPGSTLSSCKRTARGGYSRRRDCLTVPCPPITSRRSRSSETSCIRSSAAPRATNGLDATIRTTWRTRIRVSRMSSPPIG